jgi:hypothetical protein
MQCRNHNCNKPQSKGRCTCPNNSKIASISREIKNIIDITPMKENISTKYEDKYTRAFEYVNNLLKSNR